MGLSGKLTSEEGAKDPLLVRIEMFPDPQKPMSEEVGVIYSLL